MVATLSFYRKPIAEPSRERILAWQREQEFPICPNPDDPEACNVYRDLKFPDEVYERIEQFHEQKAATSSQETPRTGMTAAGPVYWGIGPPAGRVSTVCAPIATRGSRARAASTPSVSMR